MVPLQQGLRLLNAASVAVTIASLIIIVDLRIGGKLLQLIHSRPEPYRYNMVVVSLAVLSFGMFRRGLSLNEPMKYVAALCLLAAAFVSESETAKLATLAGYAAMFVSSVVPRRITLFLGTLGVLFAWAIFLLAPDVLRNVTGLWPSLSEQGHAAERIQIWTAYSKMGHAGLPWGWGVESVAYVPMTSYYASVPESLRVHLEWLHPHNNVIQIMVEMGLPGVFLALAGLLLFIVWALADLTLCPARIGLFTAVLVVALVSHGFWQMWWWSAVASAFVLLNLSDANSASKTDVV